MYRICYNCSLTSVVNAVHTRNNLAIDPAVIVYVYVSPYSEIMSHYFCDQGHSTAVHLGYSH